jgi:GNAT superfamily N-acetyltransferase
MTLAPYTPGDEDAILALFKKSFGQEMSPAYWKWRFQDNPFGGECISLMWDGEVLAGHYAVSPLRMLVQGEEVAVALSMTTMTHPDYAGRGIFTSLAEHLYTRLEQELGIGVVWGFPNANSHYGFIKNLRWKNLGLLATLSLPAGACKGQPLPGLRAGEPQFLQGHEAAFYNTRQGLVIPLRSRDYLSWRYLRNPVNQYTLFSYQQGDLTYFAVTKLYQPAGQAAAVDVVELVFPADGAMLEGLFASILAHYQPASISRINLWLALEDSKYLLLEKLGFRNGLPLTYVGMRDFRGTLTAAADVKQWMISMGDSDIY